MGTTDHRQRVSRGPRKGSSTRNSSIAGPFTTQTVGSSATSSSYSYNVEAMGGEFWSSPLIQGNGKDPNYHQYYKMVRVNPVATWGFDRTDTDFFSRFTGPCHNWFQFRSWLYKNQYNPLETELWIKVRKKAFNKFYSDLASQSANLAVDFAEMHQSRDMIAKRCKQLSRIFRNLKKVSYRWWKNLEWNRKHPKSPPRWVPPKHRKAEQPLDIVSNTWLEWKLGWGPILGSIFGVMDHQRNHAKRFRVKANSKGREITKHYPRLDTPGVFVGWTDVEISSYATCCADYEVSSPIVNDIARLTSLNPLSVIWELRPFSFVFDYFVNVGRWLEEFEASFHNGLTFVRGYDTVTVRYLNKISVPQLAYNDASARYYQLPVKNGKEYFISKQRNKWYSTPLPFAPGWDPKIGSQRLATIAALINQLFFSKGSWR